MRPVLLTAVVLGACALASVFRPAQSQPPERLPELAPAGAAPALYGADKSKHKDFGHRAATSCAASSCHGGGQVGKVGSEHSTWAPEAFPKGASDPHTKAYRVLFNSVSVEMAKKLNLKDGAHKEALCLKCHAVDSATEPSTRDQILSEGVGCGACHGPAEKWIGSHYTSEWKAMTNAQKWEQGFVPAGNLVARALNCATCHVGDADREVNHDLYAAGHPRITFEATAMHFQKDYRKHWTEKTPQPDFEIRLWVVGQAATLRAAVNLLHERAKRAESNDGNTPWPEFAGYSCYSCHQKVGEAEVRGSLSESFKLRSPGVPGWEVWSNTAIEVARDYCTEAYPGLSSPNLNEALKLTALTELRRMLGEKRAPAPGLVAGQSRKALAELDVWLAAIQAADDNKPALKPVSKGTAERLGLAMAKNALTESGKFKDHDWDALAVNYLGSAAMYHAHRETPGAALKPAWEKQLDTVKAGLLFPRQKGVRFDSPADYDQTMPKDKLRQLIKSFEQLRDATAPTGGN